MSTSPKRFKVLDPIQFIVIVQFHACDALRERFRKGPYVASPHTLPLVITYNYPRNGLGLSVDQKARFASALLYDREVIINKVDTGVEIIFCRAVPEINRKAVILEPDTATGRLVGAAVASFIADDILPSF